MTQEDIILGLLASKYGLTPLRYKQLGETYTSLEIAVHNNFDRLKLSEWSKKLQSISNWKTEISVFELSLKSYSISLISYISPAYPNTLKDLKDPPVVLFYQGDIKLLSNPNLLTVVGSRNYTRYSQLILDEILIPVVQSGLVVVSGLALGIDMLAHEIAVNNQQPTIGVIGSGLDDDSFYPSSNLVLKNQIVEKGGLILSEYPTGFAASKYSFPRRNRILAALSPVTWVVEASDKSGSLITANQAKLLDRKLVTNLISLFEKQFSGNVSLLQDGSILITRSQDLLKLYDIYSTDLRKSQSQNPKDPSQNLIFQYLDIIGKPIDEISELTKIPTQKLLGILSIMELEGYIENIGLNIWVKK
ncbi:MAG: DNA-protecting protein DprA [candidate division SR1 bacterium]|nr:DNA-protecting protein DprA [candidate division SR1 bacterium]